MFSLLGKEPSVFDVIIINDNLDDAYEHLKKALLEVSYCCRMNYFTLNNISKAILTVDLL